MGGFGREMAHKGHSSACAAPLGYAMHRCMSVRGNEEGFKAPPGMAPVPFRIHEEACSLPNAGLDASALGALCGLGEPQAGAGAQVVWLLEGRAEAAAIVARLAPGALVVEEAGLRPGRRAIFVARADGAVEQLLVRQALREPVLLVLAPEAAFPEQARHSIGIVEDASAPQAAATMAGIVAALLSKLPGLSADEVRGVLLTLAQ